jgi:ribonuclease HII
MSEAFKNCWQGERGVWLIDGNRMPKQVPATVDAQAIIKGDSKSVLIGLASIIAKEYRDNLMVTLSKSFPGYGLEKHAGYPTKAHKEAIAKLGPSPIHRKSFKGVKEHIGSAR